MTATRRKRLFRVGLLTIGGVAALAVGETSARALRLSKTWASYQASHELNLAATITGEPVGYTRIPHSTWQMPLGLTFSSNTEGFRDRELTEQKLPGVVRLAFLGDSVTEGYGVSVEDRFSSVAVRQLNSRHDLVYEGYNFGVVAQSTADEYVVLRDHVVRFAPDVVVLQVGWNDLAENARKLSMLRGDPPLNVRLLPGTVYGPGLKGFLQQHSALYLAAAERLRFYILRRGGPNAILDSALATPPEWWRSTDEILAMIADICRAHGLSLVVAYVPMDVEVQTPDEARATATAARLSALCQRFSGVQIIDVLRRLRRERNADLYLDDVHLTREGNRIVGEEIARGFQSHLGKS